MALFAVISDIHANLEALEAVLEDIAPLGVDKILHLGDVVGYNANPCEVIDMVNHANVQGVHGNHDIAALDIKMAEGFNMVAYQAILYTRQKLKSHHIDYLESLPFSLMLEGSFLFFHGSPENVSTYIANVFQAKRAFNYLTKKLPSIKIAFFGHTHVTKIWSRDVRGKVRAIPPTEDLLFLSSDEMYLINPGSVGQPRHKDNRASYVLIDTNKLTIQFRYVSYDISKTQMKIIKAKLPEFLATRLAEGI